MKTTKFEVSEFVTSDTAKIFKISPEWKRLFIYLNKNTWHDNVSRPALQSIRIEKDTMVATNGYSMCVVEFRDKPHPFPEGNWKCTLLGKDHIIFENEMVSKFPDWKAIFDPSNMEKNIYVELKNKKPKTSAFFFGGFTSTLVCDLVNTGFNHNRNKVLTFVGKGTWRFDLEEDNYNDLGTIRISGCVMPVHTENYKSFIQGGVGIVWEDAA